MAVDQVSERRGGASWRRWVSLTVVVLGCSLGMRNDAQAQDGLLDLGFGRPGVFTSVGPKGSALHFMRVLPDGRILAAGQATDADGDTHVALARYDADGVLDPTFGERGVVKSSLGGRTESARAFDILPDGKIILLANTLGGAANGAHRLALARYHANGSLDLAFGRSGSVATSLRAGDLFGADVRVQPDGRILIVGIAVTSYVPGPSGRQFVITRYNANGSPDASFGRDGIVRTFPHGSSPSPGGDSIAFQADGRILAAVIAADTPASTTQHRLRVTRLHGDGSPDRTFNNGAPTNIAIPAAMAILTGLAIQPDGKILLSAVTPPDADRPVDRADVRLTRLNADGTLDDPFALEHGFLVVDLEFPGRNRATAMAVQPDGRILVALSVNPPEPARPISALMRFNADGRRDFSFGRHGAIVTSHSDPSREPYASRPYTIALQPDGRILLGGESIPPRAPDGTAYGFSLLRFENPSAAPAVPASSSRTAPVTRLVSVPPTGRLTIDASTIDELRDWTFGATIEVTNGVPIVVERSMYWDALGIFWSGGTNATGIARP